ncbi:MAG: hypothetical protein JSS65_01230 [Armatimonadetes bacterium]|nr:hypothetical protein [Armatimonadota bacterium]
MRKTALLGLAFTLTSFAWAGETLGTKKDLTTAPATSVGPAVSGMEVFQMVAALAVVFGLLKWGLPFVMSKFTKRLDTSIDNPIRSMESANFGGGTLQVVEVRDRTLLLSVTASGASLVCDLTTTPSAEAVKPKAFFELLDEKRAEEKPVAPTHAVVDFGGLDDEDEPVRSRDFEAAKELLTATKARLETPKAAAPADERQDRVREALERLSRLTG